MKEQSARELILQQLKTKSVVKQKVFRQTTDVFQRFRTILQKTALDLLEQMKNSEDITVKYDTRGDFEAEIRFAGDLLIFQMHTNVFTFDKSHSMWKTSYLEQDPMRSYCGLINIYNFLCDSFKYNRLQDSGYLVGRVFVNHEKHYFLEGKRQLGFLYNDFINAVMDDKAINNIIESALLYTLDFDLLTPPYEQMKEVTVREMQEYHDSIKMRTAKRLGFKFQADNDEII